MVSVSHATLYAKKRIKTHPLSYRGGILLSVSVESVNDANPLVNRVFINCNGGYNLFSIERLTKLPVHLHRFQSHTCTRMLRIRTYIRKYRSIRVKVSFRSEKIPNRSYKYVPLLYLRTGA